MNTTDTMLRRIVSRTSGNSHGPVTRLMSPGDLGEQLKPFIFLDIFSIADARQMPFGMHPHSGIATVTVLTEGDAAFDDGEGNLGTLAYGGVEWMRSGRGIWHGKEIGAGSSRGFTGFQLWLALPEELELSLAESQYLEAKHIPQVGPARLVVGRYGGEQSPVRAPDGINYLLVTLQPGERWIYETPEGHMSGWFAVAEGEVMMGERVAAGEMAVLDESDGAIELQSTGTVPAKLVIGTAARHPHDLHMGYYSVHTSQSSLAEGEAHIQKLRLKLIERERQAGTRVAGEPVPVLR